MHWAIALNFARAQEDVSYEEWCALYVDRRNPTPEAIRKAIEVAHPILVRNKVVADQDPSVLYDYTIR